jgi:uncharacterized protein (DUF4415 family)
MRKVTIDDENPEWTEEMMANSISGAEFFAKRLGRPLAVEHKKPVSIRLDQKIINFFKKDGEKGWQTRMNEFLLEQTGLKG